MFYKYCHWAKIQSEKKLDKIWWDRESQLVQKQNIINS